MLFKKTISELYILLCFLLHNSEELVRKFRIVEDITYLQEIKGLVHCLTTKRGKNLVAFYMCAFGYTYKMYDVCLEGIQPCSMKNRNIY